MGCFNTDQKKTDEVQYLMEELATKYVPGHSDSETSENPKKIIAFADYLGFERQKAAQLQVQDARTPCQRLEGFISALSDFHAQAELQKVIYSIHIINLSIQDTMVHWQSTPIINNIGHHNLSQPC